LARCVVMSNDIVALEDLQVRNLVKNRKVAKSIHDAAWSQFADWLLYYGKVFGKPVVKVPPAYTTQDCSACGNRVRKALSERTHLCPCGCLLDRDENETRKGRLLARKALLLKRLGRQPRYSLCKQASKGCRRTKKPTALAVWSVTVIVS
jgi:putative transposase